MKTGNQERPLLRERKERCRLFREMWSIYYALPSEHGAWVWWIGPLVVGATAAGQWRNDLATLTLPALGVFLLRQPATIATKVLCGRRTRGDLGEALAWVVVYSILSFAAAAALVGLGHGRVVLLGLLGMPVLARYLWLVIREKERRRFGLDMAASATLAITGPAAYWVCGGKDPFTPWLIWGLMAGKSGVSILDVSVRLRERFLDDIPPPSERWRMHAAPLLWHGVNLVAGLFLAWARLIPGLVALAFGLMLLEGVRNVFRPAVGKRPAQIGLRQLAASVLFVALVTLGYWLP